jgi:hypothetical protein
MFLVKTQSFYNTHTHGRNLYMFDWKRSSFYDVYWRALCKKVLHLSPKRVERYKVTLDFLFSYVHMLVYMCDNHDKSSSQNYIPTF